MRPLSPDWRRRTFWALWGLIAFGWLNVQAIPDYGIEPAPKPTGSIAALFDVLRDDGDTRRYFAYANAILGRPYDSYFVRLTDDAANARPGQHRLATPVGPLLPWRDFGVEYPPGVLVATLPPALLTDDFRVYHVLFGIEMEILLTLATAFVVAAADHFDRGLGTRTLEMSVLLLAALGIIGVRRYDALVALCLAASVYALTVRRAGAAGLASAAAIVAKGAPLLVAPIGLLHVFRTQGPGGAARALSGALALLLLCALGYFLLAGSHSVDALAYHADRPVQIESPYGAAMIVVGSFVSGLVRVVFSFGSHNIEAQCEPALRQLSSALTLCALAAIVGVYTRSLLLLPAKGEERQQLQLTLAAMFAMLSAYILLGKVFSPQYLTWLLPLGALAASFGSARSRKLLIAGILAGQVEYPFVYHSGSRFALLALGVVALTRFGLVTAACISLLYEALPAPGFVRVGIGRSTTHG